MKLELSSSSSPAIHLQQIPEIQSYSKCVPSKARQTTSDQIITQKYKGAAAAAEHQSWARMRAPGKGQGNKIDPAKTDITAALSDALLQRILLCIPPVSRAPCSLVCQRWLRILDKDRKSLRLLNWAFLESGRLPKRFPDLTYIDLTWACMRDATTRNSISITLSNLDLSLHPQVAEPFSLEACIRTQQLDPEALDRGLAVLARGCPELQRLRVVDVGHPSVGTFSEWEFVTSNQKRGCNKGNNLTDVSAPSPQKGIGNKVDNGDTDGADAGQVQQPQQKAEPQKGTGNKADNVTDVTATEPVQLNNIVIKPGIGVMKDEGFRISSNLQKGEGLGAKAVAVAALARGNTLGVSLGPIEEDVVTPRSRRAKGMKGKGDGDAMLELGLLSLAKGCPMLQDLEVHQCTDETISSVVHFPNVQILRLVGTVEGFSHCSFTDVGLTILANKCRRLIRLELIGCEAGYAGISAIGQCCEMLEELTLSSTGFEEGWVAALSYYGCLKTLRLERCKYIDRQPGPADLLKKCPTLERLQLVCCDLRDRVAFGALMTVCSTVKELEIQDCWGLDDETFALSSHCRKIRLLSLDGCSLVTAAGLEEVILEAKDLQRLRVVHCNNIRESELSLAVDNIIVTLKEFRWRPDTKSLLVGTPAIGQAGRWFFRKT